MRPDELDAILRRARDRHTEAPPFRTLWNRALELRRERRRRRLVVSAATAVSAAALLVVALLGWPRPDRVPEPAAAFDPEVAELARSLSDWRAPLDFLLEPPGGHLFGFDPRRQMLRAPAELPDLDLQETL